MGPFTGPLRLCALGLLTLACHARLDAHWDSMFDVPTGFSSYQPRKSHQKHRQTIDKMSIGFGEFLDEGDEDQAVRVPQPPALDHPHHSKHHKHHHKHHAKAADVAPVPAPSHPHHHKKHHAHHRQSRRHSGEGVEAASFLELSSATGQDDVDAALHELTTDALRPPAPVMEPAAPPASAAPPAPTLREKAEAVELEARAKDPQMGESVLPRPPTKAEIETINPPHIPETPSLPGLDDADTRQFFADQLHNHDVAISDEMSIKTLSQFKSQLHQLEGFIRTRAEGDVTLSDAISDAVRSGDMVNLLPKYDLRAGLKPGIFPGLTNSAEFSTATLPALLGTGDIQDNVINLAKLQKDPQTTAALATHMPEAMPDDPRLHPLSAMREATAEMTKHDQPAQGKAQLPYTQAGDLQGSLLETDAVKSRGLRQDQLADLQYLRGIGQGMETLIDLFGSGAPQLATVGKEMAHSMEAVGQDLDNFDAPPAIALLETASTATEQRPGVGQMVDYRSPPQYPQSLMPTGGVDPDMHGGTFAAGPSTKPETNDLEWMIDMDHKSKAPYFGEVYNPWAFENIMKSMKAMLTKGTKMVETHDPTDDKPESMSHAGKEPPGFQDWPQPFWWTRPPAWLDDVPGWMQRLQMKKAAQNHAHASYG